MTTTEKNQSSNWVHAEAPDEAEVQHLVATYHVSERFVRDALDRDEIPRVETVGNYTYVITRFAYKTHAGIETAPVLFALGSERLITVSLEHLPSLDEVMRDASEKVADPTLIMLRILLYIDAAYDGFIHTASHKVHELLQYLDKGDVGTDVFIDFVHIEDDMNDFLSSLQPTNASLRHLLSSEKAPSFAAHRELVDTVILNNDQSIQTCEANLKSLTSIRRTYTLINSYRLDRTIKILTLASVFISIPTMFFSMYGMNIGLPEQHNPLAFIGLIVLCLLIVWSAYAIGRNKKIF
jgi:magnesium transporter